MRLLVPCLLLIALASSAFAATASSSPRGTVDASLMPGNDMCDQVNAAWSYAVSRGWGFAEVDATAFTGRQDVATNCFASFPASSSSPKSFVGELRLAPDVKIVTSVTQNPPTSLVIDGGSFWVWPTFGASTFNTNMGAQFIPADNFDWTTQRAVLTLGYATGGGTNPRGVWLQNIGVDCISPNNSYHPGSIGILNAVAQENTGGDGVYVYGCTEGIDIENEGNIGGAQNSGPWRRLNIQANGVPSTEGGWIGFDYCGHTGNCKTNRGIEGGTFTGPMGAAGAVAVSVNSSNFAVRNVSIEEVQHGVELGRYHPALGVTLDNISAQGHIDYDVEAVVHVSPNFLTAFIAMNISSDQQQRSNYTIEDEGIGGLSLCGQASATAGSPCYGAHQITPVVTFYSCSYQTGYGNVRSCIGNSPAKPSNMSISGNAATATAAVSATTAVWATNATTAKIATAATTATTAISATTALTCPTCTGGVFTQAVNTDYMATSADKAKLIRMTPVANNVTFNLPAIPPSSSWWVVVQSVNVLGFVTSINSKGANVDGSPTATTPVTVQQGQNIMIWSNGTSYYSVRLGLPFMGITGAIGGMPLAVGQCASAKIAIQGVMAGQAGEATASDGSNQDNFLIHAYGSSKGVATVKICAITAATLMAKRYNVRIFQ
jgi:hypothetical protein